MTSSLLTMKKVSRKVHTPISFRTQRQLRFTPTSSISTPANSNQKESQDNVVADFSTPSDQQIVEQNKDVSHSKEQNSDDQLQTALSLQVLNQPLPDNTTTPPLLSMPPKQTPILPWEIADNKITSLYKSSPPDLVYPAGSRDEVVNERFITRMNIVCIYHNIFWSVQHYRKNTSSFCKLRPSKTILGCARREQQNFQSSRNFHNS